jgi:uncharacterized protein (DUF433 family)
MSAEVREIKTELSSVRQELERLADRVDRLAFHPRHVPDPAYPNIVRIEGVQGSEPMIRDRYVPVSVIVALVQYGQTPQEIVGSYNGRLTLANVHGALSYYYDHQEEIDGYLAAHQAALEEARNLRLQLRHRLTQVLEN